MPLEFPGNILKHRVAYKTPTGGSHTPRPQAPHTPSAHPPGTILGANGQPIHTPANNTPNANANANTNNTPQTPAHTPQPNPTVTPHNNLGQPAPADPNLLAAMERQAKANEALAKQLAKNNKNWIQKNWGKCALVIGADLASGGHGIGMLIDGAGSLIGHAVQETLAQNYVIVERTNSEGKTEVYALDVDKDGKPTGHEMLTPYTSKDEFFAKRTEWEAGNKEWLLDRNFKATGMGEALKSGKIGEMIDQATSSAPGKILLGSGVLLASWLIGDKLMSTGVGQKIGMVFNKLAGSTGWMGEIASIGMSAGPAVIGIGLIAWGGYELVSGKRTDTQTYAMNDAPAAPLPQVPTLEIKAEITQQPQVVLNTSLIPTEEKQTRTSTVADHSKVPSPVVTGIADIQSQKALS